MVSDPVPRSLPQETWAIYELAIEQKSGLIRAYPLRSNHPKPQQDLWDLRLKRSDALLHWPSPSALAPKPAKKTAGAERRCAIWLVGLMKTQRDQPIAKKTAREQALAQFDGLGTRAFNRAWDQAIRVTGALAWSAPGRRS